MPKFFTFAGRQRNSSFPPAAEDVAKVAGAPQTPQTAAPSYRLAFADEEFLRDEAQRSIRLMLEYQKPEQILRDHGIASTTVMFGGARIPAPGAAPSAETETARKNLVGAAHYYDEARKFARLAAAHSQAGGGRDFVVATGGGPGVMEAGNLGAAEVGAPSIALNIVLPMEQAPNAHVTPEFCFNFHYFAMRKLHFLMRARAFAVFPGGFGTLDELFEVLTLIQNHRMAKMPILLFGEAFWRRIVNFEALAEAGTISPGDQDLFEYVETAEDAWDRIARFYGL